MSALRTFCRFDPPPGFLVPVFGRSSPKLRSLQPRNIPFWSMGMFKSPKHLEFANGAQTLLLFIPLILDVLQASPLVEMLFIETCCILPDPRYVCTATTLPNLRRLRVTSDAVSNVLHLIAVLCKYRDSSFLLRWSAGCYYSPQHRRHVCRDEELLWWVISIEVKGMPIGVYGLGDVMPPR